MAGRIPPAFIDELLARVDIVELIDSRVALSKGGRDYKARCPFHEEKSPSFTVSPSKQFYHCFGCGAHGTAIGFLMAYDGLEFPEAVEELATRAGLSVPRDEVSGPQPVAARQQAESLHELLELANSFYKQQLRNHPQARTATDYLKRRGMSGRTAARFEIGFAPPGWDNLLRELGTDDARVDLLRSAGLITDGSGTYDRFRNRVMFPIRNRRGKVIGFGGRTIEDETPKYLNSPETPVFHKGQELYGFYNVRRLRKAPARLLVVEGYMDVVMLAEHGIDYAVAALGTASTPEQIQQLLRACDEVVFCFDGDEAGRRAAWRALENTMPAIRDGKRVSFLFLPDGEDPDSLVRREGREDFEARLLGARSLSDYLFQTLLDGVDGHGLEQRARLVELARPLIAPVQAPALKLLLLDRLGDLSGLGTNVVTLIEQGGKAGARSARPIAGTERHEAYPQPAGPRSAGGPAAPSGRARLPDEAPRAQRQRGTRTAGRAQDKGTPSPVRKALSLLVNDPSLARSLTSEQLPADCTMRGIELLGRVIDTLRAQPELSVAMLVERFRDDPEGRYLHNLIDPALHLDDARLELLGCLQRIREQTDRARFDALAAKDRHGLLSEEEMQELRRLASARVVGGSR